MIWMFSLFFSHNENALQTFVLWHFRFSLQKTRNIWLLGLGLRRWPTLQHTRQIYRHSFINFRLFVTVHVRNWCVSGSLEHTLKPKTTSIWSLLRERFLIQPGNGRLCLALAHKSQICQSVRHSITSMSQSGTKPARPGGPACVPTTRLDTSQHSTFATLQTSCGSSQWAPSSPSTGLLWPYSPRYFFYSLPLPHPFLQTTREHGYEVRRPWSPHCYWNRVNFLKRYYFQLIRCIRTKYEGCFRRLLWEIDFLFSNTTLANMLNVSCKFVREGKKIKEVLFFSPHELISDTSRHRHRVV